MTALEVRAAADEALLWQVIKAVVEDRYKTARARADEVMSAARSERQRVLDTDGTDLGTLTVGEMKWTARITDEDKLRRWVMRNRPDELESHVRSSYVEALKQLAINNAKEHADEPFPVDPHTGAVIPGIEAFYEGGGLRVNSTPEAKKRMAQILDGLIGDVLAVDAGCEVPALDAGEGVRT